jgi:hypothetical protein
LHQQMQRLLQRQLHTRLLHRRLHTGLLQVNSFPETKLGSAAFATGPFYLQMRNLQLRKNCMLELASGTTCNSGEKLVESQSLHQGITFKDSEKVVESQSLYQGMTFKDSEKLVESLSLYQGTTFQQL